MAEVEADTAYEKDAKPHQVSLASMTRAEALYAANYNFVRVLNDINYALSLESRIRKEEQIQGLRQFVRVLRKAGEVLSCEDLRARNPTMARDCFWKALELAKGEADAPDQIPKIEAAIRHKL